MAAYPVLRSRYNLYTGINAHLQSELLVRGSWAGYHGALIASLAGALNRALPAGYIALSEESIQMQRPDVFIAKTTRETAPIIASLPTPFQLDPRVHEIAPDILLLEEDEQEELIGIGIYVESIGTLLAWIEILSPGNKSGKKLAHYINKRDELLNKGVTFVEIDLIHGISTSLHTIPDYNTPGIEQERHPYTIWFIDPRRLADGRQITAVAQFDVYESIPDIRLRLEENDTVVMKLGEAYVDMFAANPGWGRQVDYSQPPKKVEQYTQFRDLVAIAAVMIAAEQQVQAGADANDTPMFTVPPELLTELNHNPQRVAEALGLSPRTVSGFTPSLKY